MTTTYSGDRRRPGVRHWIALGASVAAVVLVVVLIAVACQGRAGTPTALPEGSASASPPSPSPGDAGHGGATGDTQQSGTGDEGDTSSHDSDGNDGNGNGGNGDGGNGDGGNGNDGNGNGSEEDSGPVALAGLEVIHKEVAVPAGGTVVGVAHCPGGTVVVGGGARMNLTSPESFGTQLRESGPVTAGQTYAWRAAATNGADGARTFRITAICAEEPAGYEMVNDDVVVSGGGGFLRRAVSCPQGAVALSGGAYTLTPGMNETARLQESLVASIGGNPHSGWLVAVSSTHPQDGTVRIRVVCSHPPHGYEVVTGDYAMSGSGFLSTPHWCPEGTHILAGGAGVVGALAGNFRTFLRESGPDVAPGPVYRGWWLALSKASSQDHTVRVASTCVTDS
jgi:hypothetical protein